jgi:mRNA-degrading endonuclease toxin of MazEF toxin-antitoxin module
VSADIRSQFESLGVSNRDLKLGEVYTLPDTDITLPKNQLQRDKGEGIHETRTAVVMQDGPTLVDPLLQTVLVAPTSSRVDLKTCNDVELAQGEGGLTKHSCCMVDQMQPVLKTHLKVRWGRLDNHRIEELQVLLSSITGRL